MRKNIEFASLIGHAISLLRHFIGKIKQRFCRWIVGQAEVVVDLGVFGVLGSEELRGDARFIEHGAETLGLGLVSGWSAT